MFSGTAYGHVVLYFLEQLVCMLFCIIHPLHLLGVRLLKGQIDCDYLCIF